MAMCKWQEDEFETFQLFQSSHIYCFKGLSIVFKYVLKYFCPSAIILRWPIKYILKPCFRFVQILLPEKMVQQIKLRIIYFQTMDLNKGQGHLSITLKSDLLRWNKIYTQMKTLEQVGKPGGDQTYGDNMTGSIW